MTDTTVKKAIRKAIESGNVEATLQLLTSAPEHLHEMTKFGTWLHVASSEGQLDIVKALLDRGLEINTKGGILGGNALNSAASYGHYDVAKYLIERGAELDTSDPERNPLFGAIYKGHTDLAKLIIDSGIDTTVKYTGENMKDMDAIAFAREWGRTDIVQLLRAKEQS